MDRINDRRPLPQVEKEISAEDRVFIDRIRGLSILRVVLAHLGLAWFFTPYSQFIHVLLPLLFFVSGAVSYFSFLRAATTRSYLVKRIAGVLGPFYVIVSFAFIVTWLINGAVPSLDLREFLSWVLVNPSVDDMPFPMGQIWFLHSLAVIILVAVPLFSLSTSRPIFLVAPILFSLTITFIQGLEEVHKAFILGGHNFFQPLSNIGYFFLGALVYRYISFFRTSKNIVLMLFFTLVTLIHLYPFEVELNMALHTYAPDLYYTSASFAAIFLVLSAKRALNYIIEKTPFLHSFLIFMSKHAYSVFILHSLLIYLSEEWLNLTDVKDRPELALLKIVLVVFGTCLVAIPVTAVTKRLVKGVVNVLNKNGRPEQSPRPI